MRASSPARSKCSDDDARPASPRADLLTLKPDDLRRELSARTIRRRRRTSMPHLPAGQKSWPTRSSSEAAADLRQAGGGHRRAWTTRTKKRCSWKSWAWKSPALTGLIQASYELLGLISFLTAGTDEVPCLDDQKGHQGARRRRAKSTPISSAASSAPRSSPSTTSRLAARMAAAKAKGLVRSRRQGVRHEGRRHRQLPLQRLSPV